MRSSRSVTHAMRRECDLRGLGNPRGAPGGEGRRGGSELIQTEGAWRSFFGDRSPREIGATEVEVCMATPRLRQYG